MADDPTTTAARPRRMFLRVIGFLGMAGFAVLWPTNYGIDSHTWWARLGFALVLVVRALFIGYGTAMLLFRPLLTVRRPGDPELMSVPQALRALFRNGR